jgi:DNA repair protein RAD5
MRDSDGRRIVDLPTKHVTVEKLIFSDAEQRFYEMVYVPAKKKFQQLNAKGLLGKNYTNILAMLMKYAVVFAGSLCQLTLPFRLRRAVLHPSLVTEAIEDDTDGVVGQPVARFDEDSDGMVIEQDTFAKGVMADLAANANTECPICLDVSETPVLIPGCLHQWYVRHIKDYGMLTGW